MLVTCTMVKVVRDGKKGVNLWTFLRVELQALLMNEMCRQHEKRR